MLLVKYIGIEYIYFALYKLNKSSPKRGDRPKQDTKLHDHKTEQ